MKFHKKLIKIALILVVFVRLHIRDHPLSTYGSMGEEGSAKYVLNCTKGEGGIAKSYVLRKGPKGPLRIFISLQIAPINGA